MVEYQSKVHIDRPPEAVFPYLVEPAKQALWSDVPMRQITGGPFATGTRFEVTFGRPPLGATLGLELTDVQPGRRMAWRTFSGPIHWEGEYVVEPAGASGSELSQHGRLRFTGLWRLIEPLIGAEIRNGEVKELEKLKAAAEAA